MTHAHRRTTLWPLGLALLAVGACRAQPVELDPAYLQRLELCKDFACDQPPRCDGGGTQCLACLCCPCNAGELRCDPERASVRWSCLAGCFIDAPCNVDESCETQAGQVQCVPGTIDCARVNPYDLLAVCGETEALCTQCGPCADCSDLGVGEACDDQRPSGEPGAIIECVAASGCLQKRSCNPGAVCVTGFETGVVGCTDQIDCGILGCTGMPVCGAPASVCGPCGCCDLRAGSFDACSYILGGEGESRYLFNEQGGCYDVVPCVGAEICVMDSYDRPICVTY